MADEDEDDFVTIGSAFDIPDENEAQQKRFEKHEQVAVDSKGRRRFHGAFTGGFSAGYFNSAGSKEGWTPSTFVSSRSKRAANESGAQKPEDFMDEEDFGEHGIAPRKFMTKEDFTPADKEINERKRAVGQAVQEGVIKTAVPGGIPIDDFIIPSKLSMGLQLLQKMGWKTGHGIGEKDKKNKTVEVSPLSKMEAIGRKVYGCSFPISTGKDTEIDFQSFQNLLPPKDVQAINFNPKDNTHGIGYTGLDARSIFGPSFSAKSFRPTGAEKRGIKGQAFGVGAFEEEDENIYGTEDMSDYDFTLSSEKDSRQNMGWSGPPKKDRQKDAIAGFLKATRPTSINKIFQPPPLPPNYVPKQQLPEVTQTNMSTENKNRHFLSASDRGVLLGEKIPEKRFQSVFDLIPDEGRERIKDAQKAPIKVDFGNAIKQSADLEPEIPRKLSRWDNQAKTNISFAGTKNASKQGSFKPFLSDPDKQQRYEVFLASRKLGKDVDLKYDKNMTEWEKEREMEEFARASVLFRPMSTSISSRFTRAAQPADENESKAKEPDKQDEMSDCEKAAKMGLYGKLTRRIHDWHPSSVLCKRFNVPNPYPGSHFTGTSGQEKRKVNNWMPILDAPEYEHRSETSQRVVVPTELVGSDKIFKDVNRTSDSTEGRGSDEVVDKGEHNEKIVQPLESDTDLRADLTKPSTRVGPLSHLNSIRNNEEKAESDKRKASLENVEDIQSRPPMDLFKAIFNDSGESSQSESEDDDENVKEGSKIEGSQKIDARSNKDIETTEISNSNERRGNIASDTVIRPDLSQEATTLTCNELDSISKVDEESKELPSLPSRHSYRKIAAAAVSSFGPLLPPGEIKTKEMETRSNLETLTYSRDSSTSFPDSPTAVIKSKDKKHDYREDKKRDSKNQKKSKKKEKKSKKKKHKEKSHKKKKKPKNYDYSEDSSSEWSSRSDDDLEQISRPEKREYSEGILKKDKRIKVKRKKPIEAYHSTDEDRFESKETQSDNKQKDRNDEEDRVPSAREIFKKIKEQGLSLKRMSAADFM